MRARFGQRTEKDDVGEVNILESFGVLGNSGDETLEIWGLEEKQGKEKEGMSAFWARGRKGRTHP